MNAGPSLSRGAAGIAILHIERAHLGSGSWQTAHSWVKTATATNISTAETTGLCYGLPAIAFMLHAAQKDGTDRYAPALTAIDLAVTGLAHRRAARAEARIDRGEFPAFAEYDLLYGLTGIGVHLLQHSPGNDALGRILTYLVRLTHPLRADDGVLPGWWTGHGPHLGQSGAFSGGHANFGMAHGITGPLALLARALREGITVDGHRDAISTICTWLDSWRRRGTVGWWWPRWITRADLRSGEPSQRTPARPSWCYGTPGIARAQQIVGIATGDADRRAVAEAALADCLSDPDQMGRLTDTSLCHGWAGVYQTAWRSARDAATPTIEKRLPELAVRLTGPPRDPGLLEGSTGTTLALLTAELDQPPISGWDSCLLIT
ncbi:lanthionine synthetase C family protein [Streptomyces carpaticus]|uniref:lanthionine synthetase C family protein n=1 Tax=Streptomyces carpaticus TaxID=285558 RepID=UPI00220CDE95|nr:lanthionine synthetase C family protein [Streptomyces carpaticus]